MTTTTDTTVTGLLAGLAADGGATLSRETGQPVTRGYAVGRGNGGATFSGDVTAHDVESWLATLPDDVTVVGAWRDAETGVTYLDPVDVVPTYWHARRLTLHRHELAFYGLHTGQEYRPGYRTDDQEQAS